MSLRRALRLDAHDQVAVALEAISAGDPVRIGDATVTATEAMAQGHKIALQDLALGTEVMKFGYSIGRVTQAVKAGAWVHLHNLKTGLGDDIAYRYQPQPARGLAPIAGTFDGYKRADGSAGIRNEIWVLVTVGCVNKVAEALATRSILEFQGRGIDGVHYFAHPYGCSQLGDDELHTQRILAALARHPNAGGVLIIGLGCENNNFKSFSKVLGPVDPARVKFLQSQDVGDEVEAGMELLRELVTFAEKARREPLPLSQLKLGLKCGGSDGFSGITANPLVGQMADRVCAAGGTALLTEVPEMFGAETRLMDRCNTPAVFEQTVGLINGFKDYFRRYGQVIYENPSAGNKDGGISTLEEKSLGCVQKGGSSAVTGVVDYGAQAQVPGLNLVNAPGNDAVSVTALVAAGAQIVLFTTGRGTPFGGPAPTLKIATNSGLARRKPAWIDYDAGQLLEGVEPAAAADALWKVVLDCASGRQKAKNELSGFREIAIFKDGVTM